MFCNDKTIPSPRIRAALSPLHKGRFWQITLTDKLPIYNFKNICYAVKKKTWQLMNFVLYSLKLRNCGVYYV